MMRDLGSVAEDFFKKGYNCAEALTLAVADKCHIESRALPNIATPFGAGIGRKASTCGCLSGGLIGIGLLYGRFDGNDKDRENLAYEKSKLFYDKFLERFGTMDCRDICGFDISTKEGLDQYNLENKRKECQKYVEDVGSILADIL